MQLSLLVPWQDKQELRSRWRGEAWPARSIRRNQYLNIRIKTNCEPYQQVDNVVRTKVRAVVVFIVLVLAAVVVNGRWKGDI